MRQRGVCSIFSRTLAQSVFFEPLARADLKRCSTVNCVPSGIMHNGFQIRPTPHQGRPERERGCKMVHICPKTPLLHTNGERGFVFCGPGEFAWQKVFKAQLIQQSQQRPGDHRGFLVLPQDFRTFSTISPASPTYLSESRASLIC